MIAEIGNFSLSMAIVLSVLLFFFPFLIEYSSILNKFKKASSIFRGMYGLSWQSQRVMYRKENKLCIFKYTIRNISYSLVFFIFLSFICLELCFLLDDFSLPYVSHNSNSVLSVGYKISALWAAHEGSMLLWVFILALWIFIFLKSKTNLQSENKILAILGLICFGFLLLILKNSNPFVTDLENIPIDGADLNPMLQDFALIIHPPILYFGYVGGAMLFAIALGSLLNNKKIDKSTLLLLKNYSTIAWVFLSIGIALGSWWAYYELGWGGWWFWDPVENASFMPWLVLTALIHSISAAVKKNKFINISIFLCIMAFVLSLLGTFLVRSGAVTSVHAFATSPERGKFLLQFIALVLSSSLIIYFLNFKHNKAKINIKLFSYDFYILVNNIIFLLAGVLILLGTIYPIFHEIIFKKQTMVDHNYFNTIFIPLMIPAIIFMLIKTKFKFNAMFLGHIGVLVTAIGMVVVSNFEIEKNMVLKPGDTVYLNKNNMVKFDKITEVDKNNYIAYRGKFDIYNKNKKTGELFPEKRIHFIQETAISEIDILPGFFKDIYLAIADQVDENHWSTRVYYKPFVRWIWLGVIIMALGGLFSLIRKKHL